MGTPYLKITSHPIDYATAHGKEMAPVVVGAKDSALSIINSVHAALLSEDFTSRAMRQYVEAARWIADQGTGKDAETKRWIARRVVGYSRLYIPVVVA